MKKFLLIIFALLNSYIFSSEVISKSSIQNLEFKPKFEELKFPIKGICKIELKIKNELIGYITFKEYDKKTDYFICKLYISTNSRGMGYGRILVNYVCDNLKQIADANRVILIPAPFEEIDGVERYIHDEKDFNTKQVLICELYSQLGFAAESIYMFKDLKKANDCEKIKSA
ncbi:MAG: GNAT family N-acetyltransferase [Candidatus Babeliales bacterium]|nr:GNAT family N-acetyltransferase [Candidatus Babeliales bacterium]